MDDFFAEQQAWADRATKAQATAAQAYNRMLLPADLYTLVPDGDIRLERLC